MMFEVKKKEYVNKTFRIQKVLADELSSCAAEKGVSLNELFTQCCRYALDNMKIEPEENESTEQNKR